MGLWNETPTAAQAAVGVSVFSVLPGSMRFSSDFARRDLRLGCAGTRSLRDLALENGIVLETKERTRLVTDLLTQLAAAVPGSEALSSGSSPEGCGDP